MMFEFNTTTLKRQVEENPLIAVAAIGTLLGGAAKLMNANTSRKNSKT